MPVRMQAMESSFPLRSADANKDSPAVEDSGDSADYDQKYGVHQQFWDPEAQEFRMLVPGMSKTETMLRWGFINKVYGIIFTQLALTTAVAATIMFDESIQSFVLGSVAFQITCAILPLIGLIPLYIYQRRHPHNLIILALWTLALSVGVGSVCTLYEPLVVLEALAITSAVVGGLTLYTFHAARRGIEFNFLGPMLFTGLMTLLLWSLFQALIPAGPVSRTVFALFGALIFSGYLVFDTSMLINKYDLDEYIWASVNIYLDIINLFLKILQLLGNRRD